jgi:hypothetical protein
MRSIASRPYDGGAFVIPVVILILVDVRLLQVVMPDDPFRDRWTLAAFFLWIVYLFLVPAQFAFVHDHRVSWYAMTDTMQVTLVVVIM